MTADATSAPTTKSITVDGNPRTLAADATVRDLIQEITGQEIDESGNAASGKRLGVAVAVAGRVVPRSAWSTTALDDGAAVDVVTAAQGG